MSRVALLLALLCSGCGLAPNPRYHENAGRAVTEIPGNYVRVSGCAFDLLDKSWRPVQKADFPDRKTTRLSRYTDGSIMKVFEIDFIGTKPNVTRLESDEPMTIGALAQPSRVFAEIAANCSQAS